MARMFPAFDSSDLILAEHGATVVGIELLHSINLRTEEANKSDDTDPNCCQNPCLSANWKRLKLFLEFSILRGTHHRIENCGRKKYNALRDCECFKEAGINPAFSRRDRSA